MSSGFDSYQIKLAPRKDNSYNDNIVESSSSGIFRARFPVPNSAHTWHCYDVFYETPDNITCLWLTAK